ncbi:hypothetical protein, unlikely [Trypanosoma congolense IL3000]|uniref:Uncharacterized protein n=1 Tax=Trypanosoma congolense (strain IL3000) TaxID=1068625 RepID=F9W9W6_TRYCI|nr:hypothetical protein, unlikely [Trypanosoma congolense IL3000]
MYKGDERGHNVNLCNTVWHFSTVPFPFRTTLLLFFFSKRKLMYISDILRTLRLSADITLYLSFLSLCPFSFWFLLHSAFFPLYILFLIILFICVYFFSLITHKKKERRERDPLSSRLVGHHF